MFIKLTRLDGTPIWINAAFVVTVEPRKGGGSVVVPVGDGLDYDVRESPDSVLALLGDAPAPAILPIPTTDALKAAPKDIPPETDQQLVAEARTAKEAKPAEPKPTEEKPTEPKPEGGTSVEENPPEEKPAKKTRKAATAKKPRATRKKKPAMPLTEEQLERLKKMMPKSVTKLQNTLVSQFRIENAEEAVKALEANGVFAIEETRIVWG